MVNSRLTKFAIFAWIFLFVFAFPVAAQDSTQIFCIDGDPLSGIRTAIGCINASSPGGLVNQIVNWVLGIAITATLVSIVYSGFLYVTSSGDQKKVVQAKTFLISSISGLVVIALGVVLLNFIGVRVLGLDPWGFRL